MNNIKISIIIKIFIIIGVCFGYNDNTKLTGYIYHELNLESRGVIKEYILSENRWVDRKLNDLVLGFKHAIYYFTPIDSNNYLIGNYGIHGHYIYNNLNKETIDLYQFYTEWIYPNTGNLLQLSLRYNQKRISDNRTETEYYGVLIKLFDLKKKIVSTEKEITIEPKRGVAVAGSYEEGKIYLVDQQKLFEIDINTSERKLLYEFSNDVIVSEISPLSPDKKYITYTRYKNNTDSNFYLLNLETKEVKTIVENYSFFTAIGINHPYYWSKDSKYILFQAGNPDYTFIRLILFGYNSSPYAYSVEDGRFFRINDGDGFFRYTWDELLPESKIENFKK